MTDLECRSFVELVTDYLEGAVSPEQERAIARHLADCPYCLAYLQQMRRTIALLGKTLDEQVATTVKSQLLARFRQELAGGNPG